MSSGWRYRRWVRLLRSGAAAGLLIGLLWLAWIWQMPNAAPDAIDSRRIYVIDGDSLSLAFDAGPLAPDGSRTVRLIGIDAPEYRQTCSDAHGQGWACGVEARNRLAALVKGQQVRCTLVTRDRYQRELGRCTTAATPDLGAAMVAEGWALSNAGIASASGYPIEEARAARDKIGIWRGAFDNPRDWRDAHRLVGAD